MYTIYTGELVRIRPYQSLEEFNDTVNLSMQEPNDHWGPWYWPQGSREKDFKSAGMLEPTKYSQFAVERLDTGECVGTEEHGGLKPGELSTWLGTEIHRPHWSNGFGIEAKKMMLCYLFENFPLDSVRADTCGHHKRAWAGLEAIGMTYFGSFKGVHYAQGVLYDIPQFVIFREQWEAMDYRHTVKRGN